MLLFYTTPDFDKNLPWYGSVYRKWLLGVKIIKLPILLIRQYKSLRVRMGPMGPAKHFLSFTLTA
jgi:hypothetical protein